MEKVILEISLAGFAVLVGLLPGTLVETGITVFKVIDVDEALLGIDVVLGICSRKVLFPGARVRFKIGFRSFATGEL